MKMDQRVASSTSALSEAVLALLREGRAGKITITEVCSRANLSRPTFYERYDSLDDLIALAITERLGYHRATAFGLDPDSPEFNASLGTYLDAVRSDRRLAEALPAVPAAVGISRRSAIDAIAARMLSRTTPVGTPTTEATLGARFAAAGITELIAGWLATEHPEQDKSLYIRLIIDLTRACLQGPIRTPDAAPV